MAKLWKGMHFCEKNQVFGHTVRFLWSDQSVVTDLDVEAWPKVQPSIEQKKSGEVVFTSPHKNNLRRMNKVLIS